MRPGAVFRKRGGGHGRKGGFGYLFDASFNEPFAEALQTVIQKPKSFLKTASLMSK
jgi:hypothetical protein